MVPRQSGLTILMKVKPREGGTFAEALQTLSPRCTETHLSPAHEPSASMLIMGAFTQVLHRG